MNEYKSVGFSLVELMIALAIGLVVIASVLAFTMSSLNANTEYVQVTRLTQELRNTLDLAINDVKRAGYNQNSMKYVALPAGNTERSKFSPIYVDPGSDADGDGIADNSCIIYAYDSSKVSTSSTTGPGFIDTASGEIKGLRHAIRTVAGQSVGVIEIAQTTSGVSSLSCAGAAPDYDANYPVACSSDGWCPLSEPRQINVKGFTIVKSDVNSGSTGNFGSQVRRLDFTLTGSLSSQPTILRSVQSSLLVRADCLYLSLSECNAVPTP